MIARKVPGWSPSMYRQRWLLYLPMKQTLSVRVERIVVSWHHLFTIEIKYSLFEQFRVLVNTPNLPICYVSNPGRRLVEQSLAALLNDVLQLIDVRTESIKVYVNPGRAVHHLLQQFLGRKHTGSINIAPCLRAYVTCKSFELAFLSRDQLSQKSEGDASTRFERRTLECSPRFRWACSITT
jgi:hypothetical protein